MLKHKVHSRKYAEASQEPHAPYREVLDAIRRSIACDEIVVLTSLPRGGTLQIAQPVSVSELLLRPYARQVFAHDKLSWRAMLERRGVVDGEVWSPAERQDDPFFADYLLPSGMQHAAAAPLAAPVLQGYPGSIHLYRAAEPFSESEAGKLLGLARQLDVAAQAARAARRASAGTAENDTWRTPARQRQFILDSRLRWHYGGEEVGALDERLRDEIRDHARRRLENLNGESISADRVSLADGRGQLWNFRAATHREYPALGSGAFIFFSAIPDCCEWAQLRAADFQADPELSRIIPALQYMKQEFAHGPSLRQISRQVHLSPFHFHRRFTALLGITPKHFLLDCQICHARRELLKREKDLATIATDCGFAHQSHFTSRFKQATGLTPTRWRRAQA